MLNEKIRKKYSELKCAGERNRKSAEEKRSGDLKILEYMKYLVESGEASDFEDICFCLWNISDSYAMLRDSENEYLNHLNFADRVSCGENKYKFWTVCDTTQRFTLILGGKGVFWQELYRDAADNSFVTDENYRIAYEAHRTAMSVHPSLYISKDFLYYADEKFSEFLENNKHREEYGFFRLIYFSAKMKAFGKNNIYIEDSCSNFFPWLCKAETPRPFLLGEWGNFNSPRGERNMASVGITAAVNSLIDIGENERAKKLYTEAKSFGLPENAYIDKRLGV